eukprot:gnl/TRDRNA2_/TRDRNA2_84554_c0_seq3.p1 gnl/TRDRNA2_/TRDRNA2_84554_c0~~gnl/TRDRNA2_/TRDRNA2_84554_c0_seq3.p1  ORF type:complete len:143 (+),score=21.25 gnl/TRDRNA2_/TRDRNA2_84554_c0_seq3:85-513(+)
MAGARLVLVVAALAVLTPVVSASAQLGGSVQRGHFLERMEQTVALQLDKVEHVAAQQQVPGGRLLFIWIFISIVCFCVFTYLVHKWHNEMVWEAGGIADYYPKFGWQSCACLTCCVCTGVGTFMTICWPIDKEPMCGGEEKR